MHKFNIFMNFMLDKYNGVIVCLAQQIKQQTTQEENNMRYFDNCNTLEDVKQIYKKLARDLHPDCNHDRDTTADFQEMQRQYEEAWKRCGSTHKSASGETYTKDTNETAEAYAAIIEALLHMSGLMIELCGSWLWVTGNTKAHKDNLKDLGFKYSANKQAWYYHEGEYHKRGKSKKSMQDIRNMYGSESFATRTGEPEQITA